MALALRGVPKLIYDHPQASRDKRPGVATPRPHQTFEVHSYASDFAIGGVLVQEGHPVAYWNRKKLNEREKRYRVQGKEIPLYGKE